MAKGKSKKKRGGVGAKTAVGAGMLGGVASLIANKATGEAIEEAVKLGAGHLLGLRKAPPALEKDLGYKLMKLLAKRGEPARLACLPGDLDCGLLALLDAVQALRKVRLVKFADGRRLLLLTALGRESLQSLSPRPKDKDKAKDPPKHDEPEDAAETEPQPVPTTGGDAKVPANSDTVDEDD